jgi:cellulose synthase/poly-beta-1,6-N-acetylglucosamine synthase-like glycosyltransferase
VSAFWSWTTSPTWPSCFSSSFVVRPASASVAIAEAAGLLVVRHETRGRAAAINRGVQEATAPIICVLHADTLLPDDAVAVMRRVLADPGTALAGFTPLLSGPDRVRWGTTGA